MQRRQPNPTSFTGDSKRFATDSFTNFAASMGYGASNLSSGGTYGFNPITRNHTLLEWAYRGSWLVRQVVDCVADDMTRQGITIQSEMPPDDIDELMQCWDNLRIWDRLNSCLKWARLYGGCIAEIVIKGQRPETPLRIDTIGEGQFAGLRVLDRWMVWPHLEDPVTDLGADYGLPKYYEVVSDAKSIPHEKIHHTRCIRMDGIELPYWQRIAENFWGLSVIEPLYDRLLAFDSTTQGAAQLVYRAHLRTLKIENLRELIAFGGPGYQAIQQQLQMIRLFQSNEQLTVLDATDEFETHQYGFGGLSDLIVQFAQQLSGAAAIPLVRLFGQSPAGLNATGDSDIRNYYDFLKSQQETRLRIPITQLLELCSRCLWGKPLPEGFDFDFNPLWQETDEQKAAIAVNITNAISKAYEDGIVSMPTALKELRQTSKITGLWSNISDEDIEAAEEMPPPAEMAMKEMDMQEQALKAKTMGPPGAGAGGGKPAPGSNNPFQQSKPRGNGASPAPKKAPAADKHFIVDQLPEGMTAVVGPDEDSEAVWLVEQRDADGAFKDFKVLVHFPDRESAMAKYSEWNPLNNVGSIHRISMNGLRDVIAEAKPKYILRPDDTNASTVHEG